MLFSANLGFLWKDRPFLERIKAARAAGFTHLEFHDHAQSEDVEALKDAINGMPVVGINARMGPTNGCAAIPGMEAQAKEDIATAIAVARAIGAKAVHVMSGRTEDPAGMDLLVARLREACDEAPEITMLVEPLCPQAFAGYFVPSLEKGVEVIEKTDRPNAKIMYDCYHMQRTGGDILARYEANKDLIGHIQIAGGLTRAEPDDGELNYGFLLPAFVKAGYDGPFGCEYNPRTTVEEGLGWRDAFTR
ncbi:hydroxypyruvate isomerase family protein [Acuticoccus kandeliae]|uniref:hydroxypyruvate isomerase family protein n=1 Tax=Acuticoccus kandeliae TaxID=2073160 RepID=UPI000D3E995A|nr:TIM barrel protein [Acuticoccus kandeliae]